MSDLTRRVQQLTDELCGIAAELYDDPPEDGSERRELLQALGDGSRAVAQAQFRATFRKRKRASELV
jgi:hypothetical protein